MCFRVIKCGFNSVLNFRTWFEAPFEALFEALVLVVADLDLNCFSSPESSPQQINSLLTSPIVVSNVFDCS